MAERTVWAYLEDRGYAIQIPESWLARFYLQEPPTGSIAQQIADGLPDRPPEPHVYQRKWPTQYRGVIGRDARAGESVGELQVFAVVMERVR